MKDRYSRGEAEEDVSLAGLYFFVSGFCLLMVYLATNIPVTVFVGVVVYIVGCGVAAIYGDKEKK